MLITFEGIDCCGKSTQIELLATYLKESGYNVLTLREPGGTAFAEKIRNLLLDKSNKISSISELFLFESARYDLVENVIKPAIDRNEIVLIDRFYDSTLAYQGYGRGISQELINNINEIATQSLIPDLTFYLDISFETSLTRGKEKKLDRMELSGEKFFQNVIEGFRTIARNDSQRILQLDGTLSIDEIFTIIKSKVLTVLNKTHS